MDGWDGADVPRVRERRKDVLARRRGAPAHRPVRKSDRRTALAAGATALAVFAGGVATTGGNDAQAAPAAHDFTVTAADLSYILEQIHIAEHHVASATPQDP